jgi:hypothetical protein
LMQASADVDYVQNNTQEKASQRAIALEKRLIDWRKKLKEAETAAGSSAARFGMTTRRPARIKEHPGGNGWSTWWPT